MKLDLFNDILVIGQSLSFCNYKKTLVISCSLFKCNWHKINEINEYNLNNI